MADAINTGTSVESYVGVPRDSMGPIGPDPTPINAMAAARGDVASVPFHQTTMGRAVQSSEGELPGVTHIPNSASQAANSLSVVIATSEGATSAACWAVKVVSGAQDALVTLAIVVADDARTDTTLTQVTPGTILTFPELLTLADYKVHEPPQQVRCPGGVCLLYKCTVAKTTQEIAEQPMAPISKTTDQAAETEPQRIVELPAIAPDALNLPEGFSSGMVPVATDADDTGADDTGADDTGADDTGADSDADSGVDNDADDDVDNTFSDGDVVENEADMAHERAVKDILSTLDGLSTTEMMQVLSRVGESMPQTVMAHVYALLAARAAADTA